jgi:flagella basal body P-ring formation protein FlgA
VLGFVGPARGDALSSGSRSIKIQSQIEVQSKAPILLGDIAEFDGFTSSDVAQLKSLAVTEAPAVGESRCLSGAQLTQTFRSRLKSFEVKAGERIALIVPPKLVILRKSFAVEQNQVESELRQRFKENCPSCEFEFVRLSLPIIHLPEHSTSSNWGWKLRVRPEMPRGTFTIPLEVSSDDSHFNQTYWVTGQVEIQKTVAVAKRNISLGEKLSEDDFSFEKKDITFITDSTPTEAELKKAFAARTLQAEQVIVRSALRKESDLKYGESVKVVSGNDRWQISIDGISQATAELGDTVKVKIPRTQKLVSGVLIAKGVVEVR